uniref:Uncharacterized protein n=1 Tax=viral metagenome TaxID=1070528 RepID=A0A6H1Z9L0_9ZZZZ
MNEDEIKQKLDLLADHQAQRDAIALQKAELADAILTTEIKAQLAEIDAEFAGKTEAVNANIAVLETEVKQAVVEHGTSVKGTFLHAIWNKGHVSWDTRSLDGYAVAHPELLSFRKEGEPSVSLRKV